MIQYHIKESDHNLYNLYIGDSYGRIHVLELRREAGGLVWWGKPIIVINELLGDPINCIHIPEDHNILIVHSRDNAIREISVDGPEIKARYYGGKYNLVF